MLVGGCLTNKVKNHTLTPKKFILLFIMKIFMKLYIPSFHGKDFIEKNNEKNKGMNQMVQKKEEQKDTMYVSDSFINLAWGQVDKVLERASQFRERPKEAYVKVIDETVKFNSEFRQVMKTSYEEAKKANEGVLSAFIPPILREGLSEKGQVVLNQQRGVFNQFKKLTLMPMEYSFNFMEKLEQKTVENSRSIIENFQNQGRKGLIEVGELNKKAKESQEKIAHGVEDSLKVLVGAGSKN